MRRNIQTQTSRHTTNFRKQDEILFACDTRHCWSISIGASSVENISKSNPLNSLMMSSTQPPVYTDYSILCYILFRSTKKSTLAMLARKRYKIGFRKFTKYINYG